MVFADLITAHRTVYDWLTLEQDKMISRNRPRLNEQDAIKIGGRYTKKVKKRGVFSRFTIN